MRTQWWSESGSSTKPNEDWSGIASGGTPVVVLDGGTARTETGCIHGVAWYAQTLGAKLLAVLQEDTRVSLTGALAESISGVADMHRVTCDLSHPGTPSAAVGIARQISPQRWEYAVLGDVTVVLDTSGEPVVVADNRISTSASAERGEADRWPIGSPEKEAALVAMKHEELAARNRSYWIAAADPQAADHAITGDVDGVIQLAILTDGAARAHSFGLSTWPGVLETLEQQGPRALISQVRKAERADPDGQQWPRNKKSDDATVVYINRLTDRPDEAYRPSQRAQLKAFILG